MATATKEAKKKAPKKDKAQEEATGKEAIYIKIAEVVQKKTNSRIGKTGGHDIFDLVVSEIFGTAVKDGTFRFNGGFGSLRVRKYGPGSRNLPSGQSVSFGDRVKLRYEEGVSVRNLLGGDSSNGTEKTAQPATKGEETLDLD